MSEKVFKVGDRVVIVKSRYPDMIGEVCTVVGDLVSPKCSGISAHHNSGACWCMQGNPLVHRLDLPSKFPYIEVAYPPSHLELYRDDGNEKGEWTDELLRLCRKRPVGADR